MSPLEIEILMHYYTTPGDYRDGDFTAPAVKEAMRWMCDEELLTSFYGENNAKFGLMERGRAYIEALKRVPLPTRCWQVKWPENPETLGA